MTCDQFDSRRSDSVHFFSLLQRIAPNLDFEQNIKVLGERENLLITIAASKVGNLSVIVVPEVHPTPAAKFHTIDFSSQDALNIINRSSLYCNSH